MPATTTVNMASPAIPIDASVDPLAGVDHIIVIDNGAHNIRIASIPYPFPTDIFSSSTAASPSSSSLTSFSSSSPTIDPAILAQHVAVDTYPNAIARTRSPHTIPASSAIPSPTAPPAGTKTSIFVSSHIHSLLDDYAALHLRLPHQSGIVVDWVAQKQIWDHVLTNHLAKLDEGKQQTAATKKKGAKLLAGKAVIITEAYNNLETSQHAMDLLMFEQYGAQAVWRTNAATLIGLGTDAFRSDLPVLASPRDQAVSNQEKTPSSPVAEKAEATEAINSPTKRPLRTPRASTAAAAAGNASTHNESVPRLLPTPRPECMLVLDLGYSFCHAIPIIAGTPIYPAIRRLELGGKMLINLLKETLSFQQLDMMDESWIMSHIFSRTSFVAPRVGERVYGSDDRMLAEIEKIRSKVAGEWTYNDLLLLSKFGNKTKGRGRAKRGGEGEKELGVTWSLPDYGGNANSKGGQEARDRARYGFILEGPNPPPFRPAATQKTGSDETRSLKRQKPSQQTLLEWESSFIATNTNINHAISGDEEVDEDEEEDDEDKEDLQTLSLTSERFSIIENLFNPSALGMDQMALPELVLDSISSIPTTPLSSSFRRNAGDMMWSNIVLIGGLANMVGMRRRLINELRPLAPSDVPVHIWPDPEARPSFDASMLAINAGVQLACQISAEQTIRQELAAKAQAAAAAAGGASGGSGGRSGKKKPTKGRASGRHSEMGDDMRMIGKGQGEGQGRWMTYAQYMNPATFGGGGSGGDSELVKAANAIFYRSSLPSHST